MLSSSRRMLLPLSRAVHTTRPVCLGPRLFLTTRQLLEAKPAAAKPDVSDPGAPPQVPKKVASASDGPDTTFPNGVAGASSAEIAEGRVAAIAEQILTLNLVEINALGRIMRQRLGLPADFSPTVAVGGGGGGGAAGAAAEEPVAEAAPVKSIGDVQLVSFPSDKKISLVKEARSLQPSLGLKEAKELIESAPCILKDGLPIAEAEKLKAKLEEMGAKVNIL
eukprot:TRINITY_DN3413_c0_g1_i1.p2 TRINITY_DN3413_c0_g1~~TRINITY_DN3413_c0_g1_i1.p2  ORF type:complete len:222 (+),score=29.46 TRINITY_DN3413_c0_g1_i1:123-788(+)